MPHLHQELENAIRRHDREAAVALIPHIVDIDRPHDTGATVFQIAVAAGLFDVADALLAQGADIDAQTGATQENALLRACAVKDRDAAIVYLIRNNADVNCRALSTETPLFRLAAIGGATTIETIIRAGARVDDACYHGWTPLMNAAFHHNGPAVRTLLMWQADVMAKNAAGHTALQCMEDPDSLAGAVTRRLLTQAEERYINERKGDYIRTVVNGGTGTTIPRPTRLRPRRP